MECKYIPVSCWYMSPDIEVSTCFQISKARPHLVSVVNTTIRDYHNLKTLPQFNTVT